MKQEATNIYRNLMAVGLLGTAYRITEDAETINNVVEATLEAPLQFRICRAIVSAMAGTGAASKSSLAAHVQENPDDEPARLAYAIALMVSGDPDGKQAIEGVLATTSNSVVRLTANNVLDYLRKEQFVTN